MSQESETRQRREDLQQVERACQVLIEHFDSVQIFATRYTPEHDGTVNIQKGLGNFFTRYGHVRNWVDTVGYRDQKEVNEEEQP